MCYSQDQAPKITLRIPGAWSDPGELLARLPDGFRLTHEAFFLPDGTQMEFVPMPPDDQFPEIFESSCCRPPSAKELSIVTRYTVNVGLICSGGSPEAARKIMQAGTAIIRAGGAGVFIDNCTLAHGGGAWIEMTDDGGADAISCALIAIVRDRSEIDTVGMQTMGFPDLLMSSADAVEHGNALVDIVRYLCAGERSIDVGHLLGDEESPRFQVVALSNSEFDVDSPVYNPYGRLTIASVKDIAERN